MRLTSRRSSAGRADRVGQRFGAAVLSRTMSSVASSTRVCDGCSPFASRRRAARRPSPFDKLAHRRQGRPNPGCVGNRRSEHVDLGRWRRALGRIGTPKCLDIVAAKIAVAVGRSSAGPGGSLVQWKLPLVQAGRSATASSIVRGRVQLPAAGTFRGPMITPIGMAQSQRCRVADNPPVSISCF